MQKRHFEAFAREIADYIRTSSDTPENTIRHATFAARVFADIAKTDNPRFNRDRFMRACGLES